MSTLVTEAVRACEAGYFPLLLLPGQKRPASQGWQNGVYSGGCEGVASLFGRNAGHGLGIRLGSGLADVDLDSPEARQVAGLLLPPTAARSGRASSRSSHWWYRVERFTEGYAKHTDSGACLVELRADSGHQTAVCPTVHHTGEAYEWEGGSYLTDAAEVSFEELKRAVASVALAALLARHWPAEGERHDAALCLAGGLLRASEGDLEWSGRIMRAVCLAAGDEEGQDRETAVNTTAARTGRGDNVRGWPSLGPLLTGDGEKASRKAAALAHEACGTSGQPDAPDPATDDAEPVPVPFRSRLLDIVALLDPDRPPRRWMWDGLVPEGEHVSLTAPGGTGKSLLVLALTLAALRGEGDFIGRVLDWREGGKVLYIDMENSEDDWAERLADLITRDEARKILGETFFPLSLPSLAGLDTARGAAALTELIDAAGLTAGDLVVLDSTQRITEGEENANDTMRNLYRHATSDLKRRGLTVIRTDNTGWAGERERGASGKRDDVGISLLYKRDRDTGLCTLEQPKRRAAGKDGGLTFRIEGGSASGTGGPLRFTPDDGADGTVTFQGDLQPDKSGENDVLADLLAAPGHRMAKTALVGHGDRGVFRRAALARLEAAGAVEVKREGRALVVYAVYDGDD